MADLDRSRPLVWIDCEVWTTPTRRQCIHTDVQQMTGLDPDTDVIIEIFCIITNGNLDVLDERGWGATIHQTKERMDLMDDWCTKTHRNSGLTAAVLSSNTAPQQAANELFEYIKKYVPESKRALLAGNSVHADKAFLRREPYKKIMDHLHHRILDVSTIKEAAIRWSSLDILAGVPMKKGLHQAKEDILESIEEAKYYKEAIFKRPVEKKAKTE
jgi:oligoribonuclease (3'-5' exoribonuclease)